MATKKFDADVVLEQAINTFWQYGYHGTSMQQLLQATGLRPGSLYREFESKEGLYLLALSRYAATTIDNVNNRIKHSSSVLEGIKSILANLFEEAKAKDYCGCFLVKTQLELSAHNASILTNVSEEFAKIEANYCANLTTVFTIEQSLHYAKQLMLVILEFVFTAIKKINPKK
ncbi:TetR/AcrR family transcriptional regulator [Paraglaciecola aquimarina]|uniref:TetR/AcrR family transcriptional regulator n=1 Tax=Paraglaciecola aquimarina TaxID=1235557 RepID=A0ABU3T1V6_9ALTE|nr:TetR/AcrR family transcriptional regulator [Paraglaciecola aquimarina]MDU0356251.1 TetR/AcrR family transcriptional regulator [Paraglaciecola aquimarina]